MVADPAVMAFVGHDSIALGAVQHRLGGAADGCCHG
jgi:hypothetical protein